MERNKTFFLRAAAFLLLLTLILAPLQAVLARKTLEGPWDNTNKIGGFYNEPEDEFEVIFYGSSHTFCTFVPLQLWQETGVKSYVFATQQQPPWATYVYLKEVLREQSPSLMVLESWMLLGDQDYYADAVTYTYMDELPMSWDKVKLAWLSAPDLEGRLGLLFNFIKYHGRWNELTEADFTLDRSRTRDPYKGFVLVEPKPEQHYPNDVSAVTEQTPLRDKQQYWLEQIIELCREAGVELWIVKSPSNIKPETKAMLNTVEATAERYGVPFFDFNENYGEIGLTEDMFYDWHHLDAVGATRLTDYFGRLLTERMPDLEKDPENAQWAADLALFRRDMAALYGEPSAA